MDSSTFRAKSKTNARSHDLKCTPTYADQQACHKIPNAQLAKAYNRTDDPKAKADLMGHAHSSGNIFYSRNNKSHTKQEMELTKRQYSSTSTKSKRQQIRTSMQALRQNQSSPHSTAATMRQLFKAGGGYRSSVSSLDKRTFNSRAEKKQIDRARKWSTKR